MPHKSESSSFSIALVDLSLYRSLPASHRPPRAFRLSLSQQAYVNAHTPLTTPAGQRSKRRTGEEGPGLGVRV
eukprot:344303-Hanusia_phi.AAC.1